MVKIKKLIARQILDSRGNPTVEAEMFTAKNHGKAIVPSGASTGIHEALELRDKKKAYGGKGVLKAVSNVNTVIAKKIQGKTFKTQQEFDQFLLDLDGTANKSRLGVNSILTASMSFARLLAQENKIPLYRQLAKDFKNKRIILPVPFSNVINGGVHAGNALEMQEFMLAPIKAKSFSEGTRMVAETYHELKIIIQKKYGKNATNVGDEGGFAPPIKRAEQALDLMTKAVETAGYTKKISFAMDPAASEFFNKKSHTYLKKRLSPEKLQKQYEKIIENYPLVFLEDPFDQDDFGVWKRFTLANSKKVQIVGDDLTVTNPARVQLAIDQKLCTALLLKINQIGTITESLAAASLAKRAKWDVTVSHRSGETEDPFIADLAVGLGMGQIKIGAPARTDRVAKYNQLLRIEEELGTRAKYAKW